MALSLKGKVAIVTGASTGIGADIAYELARRGAQVALAYTSDKRTISVNELKAKISQLHNGSGAIAVQEDLRRVEAPEKIVHATRDAFGDYVDILVNNAGVTLVTPLKDLTADNYSHLFDLNIRAVILMCAAVLPHLRAPGRIINIGSISARACFTEMSIYSSSKGAVEGFTRSTAPELASQGHTINVVAPGPVRTTLLEAIPEDRIQMIHQLTPFHRLGTPDDIAQVVAFLAEESSRWITGQAISVSGGYSMY